MNREGTLRMNRLSAEGRRIYFDVVRAARTPEDESHDREIAALSERIASLPAEE